MAPLRLDTMWRTVVLALIVVVASSALCHEAAAHDGWHGRIERADERLRDAPHDAAAWLERARLQLEHGDGDAAWADAREAARVGADTPPEGLALLAARIAEGYGPVDLSATFVVQQLARRPADAAGWELAAEVLTRHGELRAAAIARERAASLAIVPGPERTLAAAEAWCRAGDAERAQVVLDEAVATFGAVPALVLAASDRARADGDLDGAIVRLAPLLAARPDDETWLTRRGDLHWEAGRPGAARADWRDARDALASRPARRRGGPAGRALAQGLATRLGWGDEHAAPSPATTIDSSTDIVRTAP